MSTSVTNACGAGSDGGGGDQPWTDPGNITADDSSTATCSLGAAENSNLLIADVFGFSIPSGATVEGIVVAVKRYALGDAEDLSVRLRDALGIATGDDQASIGVLWPGSEGSTAYGGISDDWSAGFDDADVNSGAFGVQIQATSATGATLRVQYVEITVYYSGGVTHQPQIVGNPQLRSQTRLSALRPAGVEMLQAWEPVVVVPDTWTPQVLVVSARQSPAMPTRATVYAPPQTEVPDSTPGWAPQFVAAFARGVRLPLSPTLAIFTPPDGFDPLCACPLGAAVIVAEFATARIVQPADDPYVPASIDETPDRGPLVTDTSNSALITGASGYASALVIEHCHCG